MVCACISPRFCDYEKFVLPPNMSTRRLRWTEPVETTWCEKETMGKYAVEHLPKSASASQMVFDVCLQNSLPISLCNRVTQPVAHVFRICFHFLVFRHSCEKAKNCCTIVLTTLHTSSSTCCTTCLTSLSQCLCTPDNSQQFFKRIVSTYNRQNQCRTIPKTSQRTANTFRKTHKKLIEKKTNTN